MVPFPNKKYQIIYADPAWKSTGDEIGRTPMENPYPDAPVEFWKELPVQVIADDNSLLFLWVFSPDLHQCIHVGECWGFKYRTVAFVWEKQNSNVGRYTLPQTELCLVFKRGKIPQPRGKRNIRQFLSCKRGRHSEKPKEIRHRITEMFPTQSKI